MNRIKQNLQELEEVKEYLKAKYNGKEISIVNEPYIIKNNLLNYIRIIDTAIDLIKSSQHILNLYREESFEHQKKIRALESKEIEPIIKEFKNDFIDILIDYIEEHRP